MKCKERVNGITGVYIYTPTHHSKVVYKGEFIPRKRVSLGDKTDKNGAWYFWGLGVIQNIERSKWNYRSK